MNLSNYTQSRANRLVKLSIPDIKEPFPIRVLWLRWISVADDKKKIHTKIHQHSFFEVHFIISGETAYKNGDNHTFSLSDGDAILFAPDTPHSVVSYTKGLTKLCLAFSCDKENSPLYALCKKGTHQFTVTEEMRAAFETILAESDLRSVFSATLLKNSVLLLIYGIFRSANPDEQKPLLSANETDIRIRAVKQYIKDNPGSFFTCQDVAAYCHFNVKYLNRIFKKETGMTLLSYIHQQKILQAQELLEHTTLSLDEISTRLGFANEYYFNSFFRRVSGITPGAYRLMIQ